MRVKKASETKAAHNDDYASHDRFEDDEWKKKIIPMIIMMMKSRISNR